MCNFISWIEHDGRIYFLENKDLKGKKFAEFKTMNGDQWQSDIVGHGAIRFFYPELGDAGKNVECEDFSKPSNFPEEIQSAIRGNRMSKFGVRPEGLLSKKALKDYLAIRQSALKDYEAIEQPVWKDYEAIKQSAWKDYEAIQQSAFWGLFWEDKNRAKAWRGKKQPRRD